MAFAKMTVPNYEPRQWALFGPPDAGKSTFAAQMKGPLLVVDSDHRFTATSKLWKTQAYKLSEDPSDNTNPEQIAKLLKDNMRGSGIKTIIFDSLTSFLTPFVLEALAANESGANRNKVAAFRKKALAMRTVQFALTGTGVDCLWIYHTRMTMDASAHEIETTTISKVELMRLRSSLNMTLKMVREGDKRGILVEWARNGRSGMTLWDETGCWAGMPELIEAAVYDGLTDDEKAALATDTPTAFSSVEEALAWANETGLFKDAVHTKNSYDKLKAAKKPTSAGAMWALWIEHVEAKREALEAEELVEETEDEQEAIPV